MSVHRGFPAMNAITNESARTVQMSIKFRIIGWAALLLGLMPLASSCSQDTDQSAEGKSPLQLGACITRAEGDAVDTQTPITFFLTHRTTAERRLFTYDAERAQWSSNALVEYGVSYHLFGFTPSQSAVTVAIQPMNGDYAYGAELTFSGLPVMPTTDVCFVTAVRGGSDVTSAHDFTEWNYQYESQSEEEMQNVNLLFDHLYANLNLLFKTNSTNTAMRSIRLKKVVLATAETALVSATVLQPEGTPAIVDFQPMGTGSAECTLLDNPQGIPLNSVTPVALSTFIAPGTTGLTLTCTYDVFNEAGHIVRKDCTTQNALSEDRTSFEQGYRTDLALTVTPTYLYVLSDEDAPELELTIDEIGRAHV